MCDRALNFCNAKLLLCCLSIGDIISLNEIKELMMTKCDNHIIWKFRDIVVRLFDVFMLKNNKPIPIIFYAVSWEMRKFYWNKIKYVYPNVNTIRVMIILVVVIFGEIW